MQKLIKALLSDAPTATGSHQHSPSVEAAGESLPKLAPRPVRADEVFDAAPLRSQLASEAKKSKTQSSAAKKQIARLAQQVAERLASCGWAVLDGLFDSSESAAVRAEMEQLEPHFHASEIWVGHQAAVGAQMTMPDIRGDRVLWMCGHHPQRSSTPWSHANTSQSGSDFAPGEDPHALQPCSSSIRQTAREETAKPSLRTGGARRVQPSERWLNRHLSGMLDAMDALVLGLKEAPNTGRCANLADRSDAMLAVYPETGARFQRHVDNTAGDGRRLTFLCYMNEEWGATDGGELCVHPTGSQPVLVAPAAGRLALFFADAMPHEVLPARRHRYSVNVWYYDTEERARAEHEAATRGRIGGGTGAAPISDADNAAAKGFLQQVLGGGNGRPAERAELERLANEAERLPSGAAHVVAQVTMGSRAAPDVKPTDVAASLRAMVPAALDALRGDLSVMRTS
ncbi:unnamed protein product [Polarella glacialis]|uniref:Fe2OG dioxygenase domain-containing protein n=1 Tax=Polarella glacialis TaxID=89957 RepID=A0A813DUG5_POLGL|nr:unnamed protein product [Polarella glacialis]